MFRISQDLSYLCVVNLSQQIADVFVNFVTKGYKLFLYSIMEIIHYTKHFAVGVLEGNILRSDYASVVRRFRETKVPRTAG